MVFESLERYALLFRPLLGDREIGLGPVDDLPVGRELLDELLERRGGLFEFALLELLDGLAEGRQGFLILVLFRS